MNNWRREREKEQREKNKNSKKLQKGQEHNWYHNNNGKSTNCEVVHHITAATILTGDDGKGTTGDGEGTNGEQNQY
jgi:hypothetical protein